jgi:hypothetical protein
LDGEVLRALMIVTNDLFPPDTSKLDLSCRMRQQAHTFRFTRRDDIIFVYVNEDLAYCGRKTHAMDSGAKYAISKDGRILRRVIDGSVRPRPHRMPGEAHRERRPLLLRGAQGHRPPMRSHDLVDDVEPQPQPGRRRWGERQSGEQSPLRARPVP